MKLFFVLICIAIGQHCYCQNNSNTSKHLGKEDKAFYAIARSTSALRLTETTSNENLIMISESGKEGYFRLDANDNASVDNEGTIIVNRQGKRYKRIFEGEVNITWFGAKGDGITDDTEAFTKALTAITNCIYIPYKEAGYKIASVAITKTITLRGDNKFNTNILPASNNVSCFITQAEFVEYKDLYFDGAGTKNTTGIEHKHRISTVSNCFFSGFEKGIFNNKIFVKGGKPDEQTINNCRFRNCSYGIFSEGHFINSKIINSIFHGCKQSAIFCMDDSYNASLSTTEGLTIESCLIYDSGDRLNKTAAIELRNLDFSFIRNCMVDINTYTALSLTNSQNCNISGTYFSSAAATDASTVQLSGNCSNTTFMECQFYDSKEWGFKITGLENRISDNVRIDNCSGRLNVMGDFFIDGGSNIWITNSNFYSTLQTSILARNTQGNTSVYIRGTNISGAINKANEFVVVSLKDCPNKPTSTTGAINLNAGQQSITIPHGLTVLKGQKVTVIAGNSTNFEAIKATVIGSNILVQRLEKGDNIVINYRVEVQ